MNCLPITTYNPDVFMRGKIEVRPIMFLLCVFPTQLRIMIFLL